MRHRPEPRVVLVLAATLAAACAERGPVSRTEAAPCAISDEAAALVLAPPNDQTRAAGVRFADTLDVQLEIGRAEMWPEGPDGPRLPVVVFGETGKGPFVPGPLLRAPAGTTVLARVCNALADTVWLIGLSEPGDTVTAPPGQRVETSFTLHAQGFREYRGITRADTVLRPWGPTATLAGAIVADGEDRWGDRVLVLIDWAPDATGTRFALMVNGLSWPHTERLRYEVGDTARWIVLNASPVDHPMHLHGFHFLVTARGDGASDSIYAPDRRRLAVTELLTPGQGMALEWVPERGGRWLFHCHIASHMGPHQRSHMRGEEPPGSMEMHEANHAEQAMAGLVVGIDVTGAVDAGLATGSPVRRERLLIQERPAVYPNGVPGFGYVLQRGEEPAADSIAVPGPPLLLTRGEPAEITLVNRLSTHTAVHWHGLELESYFDGVPGWTGDAARTTPLIAPGDSFIVRLAPPRAGTFIYHSHANERHQLGSGLFGPVIVLEPGARHDPDTDHTIVFSMAGPDLDIAPIVANDGADPVLEIEAGRTHRIRFINITADDTVGIAIRDANGPIDWRLIALDGADVPPALRSPRPARLVTGPGETADVELTAPPRDLRLVVRSFNSFEATIRVRPRAP